jgi:integrase
LAEYNANGKVAPVKQRKPPVHQADLPILVRHVTADFRHRVLPKHEHSPAHYACFKGLCDLLDQKHGDEPVAEFGPRKLESLRDKFVARGNCRSYANEQIGKVIKIIEHGVARELVAPDRIVALRALPPLKRGQARDNPKRSGVPLEVIRATLPHLTETAAAMVKLQLATAMRPSEIFRMRPCDIDRRGKDWIYRPESHKTEHHGKAKAVPILGDAFKALAPFMFGEPNELCFRTTKGTPWNKDSYRIAVTRAAKAAKVEHWTPYQIRHTAAQAVRDAVGPEGAQALLGHSRLSTTEVYAKASEAKAIEAARATPTL